MRVRYFFAHIPWTYFLLLSFAFPSNGFSQTMDVQTFQAFRIEHPSQPGQYITFLPPTVPISPYTLQWPAGPPTAGLALTAIGGGPYDLMWTTAGGSTIEVESGPNGNLRRIDALNQGSINGVPGQYSNDFQGHRSNASQTASGSYALIGGGQFNTASGNYSLVLGGESNTASGTHSVVAGGNQNTASGNGSAILGGSLNSNHGDYATIGGGSNNSITAHGDYGFIGGGQGNSLSGAYSFIGGGQNNNASGLYTVVGGGINNTASDTMAVVGGGASNTASGRRSVVGGGNNNTASGMQSFLGAGNNNAASGENSVVGGGNNNTASGNNSSIGGGSQNTAGSDYSFVGAGQNNSTSTGTHSAIGAGNINSITGSYSFIGGGTNNVISSDYSAIPGGRRMTLASGSDGSFGFNSIDKVVSVSAPQTFVIANADLWIANNDNATRSLRFYEAYNTSGGFPGATTNYVAFRAPNSTNANLNNTYTLPDRVGVAGQVLRLATGATTTAGTLEWTDAVTTVRVNTVDVTADNQAITSTQMDYVTLLRLTSDDAPADRTVTLADGVLSGHRLIIRCVATGTDGVELLDNGNLDINGNAQLQNLDTLTLIWDGTSSIWMELSRSDN